MARGTTSIVLVTIWLLSGSLIALCTSIAGDAWYINKSTSGNIGLIKRCYFDLNSKRRCVHRKLLTFKKDSYSLDFILIGLAHSALLTLCALLYAVVLYFFQKKSGVWKVWKILIVAFTIVAAGLAIASLVISEGSEQYQDLSNKRGWTSIVGWVAVAESIAASFFTMLLACIKPEQGNSVNGGQILFEETGSAGSGGSEVYEMT